MKELRMMREIGNIDDKYIDEAAPCQTKAKAIRVSSWAKYAGIAACAALVVGIGVFIVKQNADLVNDPSQTSQSSDFAQAAAPCEEFGTIEEVERAVGYEIVIPDSFGDYSDRSFSVMFGTMLQVQYRDADGNTGLCIRKASGTDDISGDCNSYDNVSEIVVGECSVTLKGNEDKYFLAVWSFGEYSYSVSADKGASGEELTEMIKTIR